MTKKPSLSNSRSTKNTLQCLTKPLVLLCLFASLREDLVAQQQATWIWYPGDFEVYLSNKMQSRRTERGMFYPVFWKVDSHFSLYENSRHTCLVEDFNT